MSSLNTGSGQEVLSPASQPAKNDNNAERDNDSSEREIPSLAHIYVEMLHLFKEALLLVMFFVVYAAISHDPPKVTRSPPAFPFFPEGSVVEDWYNGEVPAPINSMTQADVGLVMFYAPWDAESQETRWEYELAARHMHDIVSFSAINCWQPGSECRHKYTKVYSWPVFVAYTCHGHLLQYNGPKTATHLTKFAQNVMFPYKRINSTDEIKQLLLHHDAVVVASLSLKTGSPQFSSFYSASVKFLDKDPLGDVAFRLITKNDSEDWYLKLYLWNETLVYPSDEEFKSDAIVNWITKQLHQVAVWVAPTGTKSQQLSMYLQGPTLILFTPQNPLLESVDYYNMLKTAGLEYFNCDRFLSAPTSIMNSFRKSSKDRYEKLTKDCKKLKQNEGKYNLRNPTVTYSPVFWVNNSCANNDIKCISKQNTCSRKPCYQPLNKNEQKCGEYNKYKTSMISVENDDKSLLRIIKAKKEIACRMNKIADDYFPPMYSTDMKVDLNVSGYSCKVNNSLTFIALDSLLYHHFAEKFGIDVLKLKHKTALLIVNEKEEIHHVFKGQISDKILRQFLTNYTNNNLPRALHTSSMTFRHTHLYSERRNCGPKDLCVRELNSHDFMDTIMSDKVVVVFYYSKQCSFCNGVSYMFLSVAKLLSPVKSVEFARINGDLNTLPWEYTMETYPAILFIPRKSKSESRAYPQDLPITVSNLLSFILTNLNSSLKLNVMWTVCQQINHEDEKSECYSALRAENVAVIGETLKKWRLSEPRMKQKILRELQHLKRLHLHLATEPKKTLTVETRSKLNSSRRTVDESWKTEL